MVNKLFLGAYAIGSWEIFLVIGFAQYILYKILTICKFLKIVESMYLLE